MLKRSQLSVCTLVLPVLLLGLHITNAAQPSDVVNEAKSIRQKWGARDLIRDVEHIKEDMKKMLYFQDIGEFAEDETLFYFFRMHDFDNNSLLDGHELMAAILHMSEHGVLRSRYNDLDLTYTVDHLLEFDTNNDGYLSYIELRSNLDQINLMNP